MLSEHLTFNFSRGIFAYKNLVVTGVGSNPTLAEGMIQTMQNPFSNMLASGAVGWALSYLLPLISPEGMMLMSIFIISLSLAARGKNGALYNMWCRDRGALSTNG